jgi:hypothetical protein
VSARTRAVFAAIAVVVLVGAFVILRPSGNDPEQPATATPATAAGPLLTGGKVTKIHVAKGDTVRFRVVSPKAEEVHVHGYDLKKELSPGKVATMSFKATIDGIFEIEFEGSSTQIGQLTVDP